MRRSISETALREFIRLSHQGHKVILEASGGKTPHLQGAINNVINNQGEIQKILDRLENPGPSFELVSTGTRSSLESVTMKAANLDTGQDFPRALVLLALSFSAGNADFTNLVSVLGRAQSYLAVRLPDQMRESRIPRSSATPSAPAPGAPAPRGTDFGTGLVGRVTNAFRMYLVLQGIRSDLADDAARVVSDLIGGASGARDAISKGKLPPKAIPFESFDPSTNTFKPRAGGGEEPFQEAIRYSLQRVHEAPEDAFTNAGMTARTGGTRVGQSIRDEILEHMANSQAGSKELTVVNLRKKAAQFRAGAVDSAGQKIDPGGELADEIERVANKLEAEINDAISGKRMAGLVRAASLDDVLLVAGQPAQSRYPTKVKRDTAIASSIFIPSLVTLYDLAFSEPKIDVTKVLEQTDENIKKCSSALTTLADAFVIFDRGDVGLAIKSVMQGSADQNALAVAIQNLKTVLQSK